MSIASYSANVLADRPLGYYRFRSGAVCQDELAVSPGAYQGTPRIVPSLLADPSGGAMVCDGTTQYATVASTATLANIAGNFTLEAWVRWSSVLKSFITERGSGVNGMIYFWWEQTTSSFVIGWRDAGVFRDHKIAYTPKAGLVYHCVATVDGANVKLFINGRQIGSVAQVSAAVSGALVWGIGAEPIGSNKLTGAISELAIYNYALTPDRIQAHYAVGVAPARRALRVAPAGAAAQALTGSATGTATTTATLRVAHALTATTAAAATTAATLKVAHSLSATTTGTAVTAGPLNVLHRLVGATTGTSTTAGTLGGRHPLQGASTGVSTTAGTLRITRGLAGTTAGAATDTAAMRAAYALSGTTTGLSTARAVLSAHWQLRAATGGVSDALAIRLDTDRVAYAVPRFRSGLELITG